MNTTTASKGLVDCAECNGMGAVLSCGLRVTCTACDGEGLIAGWKPVISKSEARFWLKLVRESMLTARKAMLQHSRLYPLPLIQPQAAIERSVELRDAFRRLCESEEQLASV